MENTIHIKLKLRLFSLRCPRLPEQMIEFQTILISNRIVERAFFSQLLPSLSFLFRVETVIPNKTKETPYCNYLVAAKGPSSIVYGLSRRICLFCFIWSSMLPHKMQMVIISFEKSV